MADDLRFTDPEPRIHPTAELKGCRLGRYAAIGERVILREVTVGDYLLFRASRRGDLRRHRQVLLDCRQQPHQRAGAPARSGDDAQGELPPERIFPLSRRRRGVPRATTGEKGDDRQRRVDRARRGGHARRDDRRRRRGGRQRGRDPRRRALPDRRRRAGAAVCATRFAADVAERLQRLAWWDWPAERLFEAIPDMQSLPIEAFLDKWEKAAG